MAQICLTHAWGGMEMSCVEYARLFAERGYESFGICLEGSPVAEHFNLPPEKILRLKSSAYFSPVQSLRVRRFLRRHRIDVVFSHLLKDLWILYPALLGRPVHLFGFAHMFLRDISKKDFLHGLIYGRLERLFALSETQRRHLLDCLPIHPEAAVVLPNGVDLARFGPHRRSETIRREEYGAGPEDLVVGVIGRLDPQKGQMEFVGAAAELAPRFPNARFVLVGQTNADGQAFERALKAQITRLGLEGRIFLTGHRPDVASHMASLDIFVLPSYEEAFGKVTIEAMASGVAVVGTDSGSTPEILHGGEAGVLVRPKDPKDLARGIAEVLANPTRRQDLVRRALVHVHDEYSLAHVMERLQSEVESVVRA